MESNGVPIDLAGSVRSRPSICFWTGDGKINIDDLVLLADNWLRMP